MRILLAFIVLIAFTGAASADTITVVNEDGTKSSIEIGPSSVEMPAEPARTVTSAPAPVAKPMKKPVKKPAPPKKAAKKVTPAKKPPVKKSAKKTQNELDKKQLDKKQAEPAPVAAGKVAPAPAAPPRTPSMQRLGPAMTPDDAIRIAVDAAPPARSVHASPVNYKGLHAYEVVFRTEDGDHFVYVDRDSGRVVK